MSPPLSPPLFPFPSFPLIPLSSASPSLSKRKKKQIIFFEHVLLYNVKGETHPDDYCQPLEKAELVRAGKDITILCYSRMRYVVMQAVAELEKQGYDPEVVDLISLKPFDMKVRCSCFFFPPFLFFERVLFGGGGRRERERTSEKHKRKRRKKNSLFFLSPPPPPPHPQKKPKTIADSVKKTRRVLVVEECMKTGGIGASLSAQIGEQLFDDLDHQVVRLSSQDVPTAYAYELEAATIVQPEAVVAAVQRIVGAAVPA